MKLVLQWIVIICIVFQSAGSYGQIVQPSNSEPQTFQPDASTEIFDSLHPKETNNQVQITQKQLTVTAEDLETAVKTETGNKDLIVSTDSLLVAGQIANLTRAENKGRLTRVIPVGQLVDQLTQAKTSVTDKAKNAWTHLKEAAKNDKIGLIIVVFSTAYDSYVWLHATQYSTEVAVAQTIYSVLLALTFSVDKDLWSRLAWKVQGKFLRLFDSGVDSLADKTPEVSRTKEMATTFASYVTLSFGFQLVRMSICAYDHMITVPYLLSSTGTALALSALFTFSSFGFSDFLAKIDQTRYPFAKTVFRRFQEIRTVLIVNIAPSGKVISPAVYGFAPHIVLFSTGLLGMLFYTNRQVIVDAVEKVPEILKFKEKYDRLNLHFLQSLRKVQSVVGYPASSTMTALSCHMVM